MRNPTPTVNPSPDLPPLIENQWGLGRVTVMGQETPAAFVLMDIAEQAGVAVAVPPAATEAMITLDFQDTPAQAVFEAVAEQLGIVARHADGVVTFVTRDDAVRNLGVFRLGHADPEQATRAMESVVGTTAKVIVNGSTVVVAGSAAQVERASQFAPYLLAGPDGWRLEIRVVALTSSLRQDLGLDWEVGGGMRLQLGGGTGALDNAVVTGSSASMVVSAIASASKEKRDASLLHSATLYVLEDGEATMHQGERTPIPKYQTSPEGTTTVVGYEYVMSGFELLVRCRRVPGGARLYLEPSVSSVTGYVADAPIVTQSKVTAEAVIASGDWLVISGLSTVNASDGTNGLPGMPDWLGKRSSGVADASIVYLIRAERVFASETTASP